MNRNFFQSLSNSSIIQAFIEKPSPKWMVFLADLIIFGLCCGLTFAFGLQNDANSYSEIHTAPVHATIAFIIYTLLALILGTSKYIIRLSVIEDTYRLVLLILSASFVMATLSLCTLAFGGFFYFSFWNIFTLGVMTFALMLVMRLSIKYFYMRISGLQKNKKRVIVLGSAINSYFLATALKNEYDGAFEPVALLSLSDKVTQNNVNGIPVIPFNENTIAETFEFYRCDTLLFLSTQLELMRSGTADVFLRNHIKLLMLNQVAEFDMNSKDKNGRYKIKSGEHIRVCMTSDFFLEEADKWREDAWKIMHKRSDVVFILITKRPERIAQVLPSDWGDGYENVQLNVKI